MKSLTLPTNYLIAAVTALIMSGCATPLPPLKPNEARVIAGPQLFIGPADQPAPRKYGTVLTVPAGKTRLAIKPGYSQGAGLLILLAEDAIAKHHIKEVDLNAKGGHEYNVKFNTKPLFKAYWNRGILITDKSTGEIVAEAPSE